MLLVLVLFFVMAMFTLCGSVFSGMLARRLFLVVLTVLVYPQSR